MSEIILMTQTVKMCEMQSRNGMLEDKKTQLRGLCNPYETWETGTHPSLECYSNPEVFYMNTVCQTVGGGR